MIFICIVSIIGLFYYLDICLGFFLLGDKIINFMGYFCYLLISFLGSIVFKK